MMKSLASIKNNITIDKNGENMSQLKITEVILVCFKIINNDYQNNSGVLYTFVPNNWLDQLLSI